MTIRKTIRLVTLGAAMAALPGFALAAPPTAFDQWSVDASGNITTPGCPAGFTCDAAPIMDNGFMQRRIEDSAGNVYFQTIIGEGTAGQNPADMAFADENFVAMSNTSNGGIAGKQEINESSTVQGFMDSTSTLMTGTVFNTGESVMVIDQTVGDGTTLANSTFTANFAYDKALATDNFGTTTISQALNPDSNFSDSFVYMFDGTQTTIDIDSGIELDGGVAGAANDQTFVLNLRSGAAVAGAGAGTFPSGDTLSWAGGDTAQQVLINQDVDGSTGQFGGGTFGFESLRNKTDATMAEESSFTAFSPFATLTGTNPF